MEPKIGQRYKVFISKIKRSEYELKKHCPLISNEMIELSNQDEHCIIEIHSITKENGQKLCSGEVIQAISGIQSQLGEKLGFDILNNQNNTAKYTCLKNQDSIQEI